MKISSCFKGWIWFAMAVVPLPAAGQTLVAIRDTGFVVNGKPTYEGRQWKGRSIEGLLFNSRMVQGIFDDFNPETRQLWKYPDTQEWNAERNTKEFIAAMPLWRAHGLLAFTINLQGGSPTGYGNKGWINSAFDSLGNLRQPYFARLERILNRADSLGMVVILGLFYFGQDQVLLNETAVVRAVDNAIEWLFNSGHRNVLIEINNECNIKAYDHAILKPERVPELIRRVRAKERDGRRFLVGTSFGGGTIPTAGVVQSSDFILLHGNGVKEPERIKEMVQQTKLVEGYRPMPILFNEDDHFDFEKPMNNFIAALESFASWGFFDYRMKGETDYRQGYQSVPVDWGINSERKKGFFNLLNAITDGPEGSHPINHLKEKQ
jgi:hypothetical protein